MVGSLLLMYNENSMLSFLHYLLLIEIKHRTPPQRRESVLCGLFYCVVFELKGTAQGNEVERSERVALLIQINHRKRPRC